MLSMFTSGKSWLSKSITFIHGQKFIFNPKTDILLATVCFSRFFPHFSNAANFDCITTFEAKSFEVVCLFTQALIKQPTLPSYSCPWPAAIIKEKCNVFSCSFKSNNQDFCRDFSFLYFRWLHLPNSEMLTFSVALLQFCSYVKKKKVHKTHHD